MGWFSKSQEVSSGHYGSACEVVREAIRVLEELPDEAELERAVPGGKVFFKKLRAELRAPARRSAA